MMGAAGLVMMIVLAACLVLAVTFILRGIRGPLEVSAPHCRRCRYELRQVLIAGSENCPECGADLRGRRAVAFGRSRRSFKLVLVGLLFIVVPIGAGFGVSYARMRSSAAVPTSARGPQAFAAMTPGQLAAAAGGAPSGPWLWQELEVRWDAGELSPEEMASIVEAIATGIGGGTSPRVTGTGWGGEFLGRIVRDPKVPEAARRKLAEQLTPTPGINLPQRVRKGTRRSLSVQIPLEFSAGGEEVLIALHDIRVVGEGVDRALEDRSARFGDLRGDPPLRFTGEASRRIHFEIPTDLAPGRYEVRADVEWAALLSTPALVDMRGRPRHPDKWPDALIRRRETIVKPFEFIPEDAQLVAFLPPEKSKAAAEEFRTQMGRLGLTVSHGRGGKPQVSLMRPAYRGGYKAPAYCFEVIAVLGDLEVRLGRISGQGGGRGSSGLSATIDALPDDLRTADIILHPSPNEADRALSRDEDGNVPAIIGETIRFEDVPLDRQDLLRQEG